MIGSACHLLTFIVVALHPPYPVLVVAYIFVGFGNGIIDAAWCAWIANMANGNQISGFLQASYSLGATVAPLIATAMITRAGLAWYYFYYVLAAGAAIELVMTTLFFWKQTGPVFREENPRDPNIKVGRTREALSNKMTWIFAIFILGYVGAEVSLGGWIVVFMMKVRSADQFSSGISSTGFWAGMTVGRLLLGFVTEKIGERLAVTIYLTLAIGLELIFWLVPSFIVSAVAVALLGFILGPLFPSGTVLITKLLPKHLHVGSIGFATAFGGSGGAIFPFAVGAIAQAKGVRVLQPVILALLAAISSLWLMLPRLPPKHGERRGGLKGVWQKLGL
ncbi:MFS transporter [Phlyctema vagabunda]|uniref:MFS transporter n=1 Tax=Phlyctema vagabunda TaxID=108571 RepID=A0ABR4P757_9HELO